MGSGSGNGDVTPAVPAVLHTHHQITVRVAGEWRLEGRGEGSPGGVACGLGPLNPVLVSAPIPPHPRLKCAGAEVRGALASGVSMAAWGRKVEGGLELTGRDPPGL